jgi:hypothetical protein
MCDFDSRCVAEEELPAHLWRLVVERGRTLDIDAGGFCDAKDACIQFWCGPEDQPKSWKGVPIHKRALHYPRALVGAVHTRYGEEPMTLRWLLYPYDKAAYLEGVESSFNLRHRVERYSTDDDLEWCRAKFEELLDWARQEHKRRAPARYDGTVRATNLHCPCDPDHRVVVLDPPFYSWEYYCLDCGALTCVREKLPTIKPGTIGTITQAGYPRDKILPASWPE